MTRPGSTVRAIRRLAGALLAASLLATAACGGDDSSDTAASDGGGDGSAAFPVTVQHSFGETVIPEEPERIVTLGLNDMDAVFALGKVPVGAIPWFTKEVVHPWSEQAAEEAGYEEGETKILSETYELNFEAIAAADPDLITAIFRTLTEEEYQTLSKIAPTIAGAPGAEGFKTSWQDQTRIIGQAMGRGNEAEQLVAEVEEAYAEAAERHPEWDGAEVAFISLYEGGQLLVYTGGTAATNFLELLGFTVPEEFNAFFDEAQSVAAISTERLGVIDRDLIVSDADLDSLKESGFFDLPTYQNLAAVRENRILYPDEEINDGVSFRTVLSMPWILERLEDDLAAAFQGEADPPA